MPSYTLNQDDNFVVGSETAAAFSLSGLVNGKRCVATVSPGLGMTLLSFKIGDIEILCTARTADFNDIRKGLGPIIGPHFNDGREPPEYSPDLLKGWPHLESDVALPDPFQHGIGRYVPWEFKTEHTSESVSLVGNINGDMIYNGSALKNFQGFDFKMQVMYTLSEKGLDIAYNVAGDAPVCCGIHFYYALMNPGESYALLDAKAPSDAPGNLGAELPLKVPLSKGFDHVFTPVPNKDGHSEYLLLTPKFSLRTRVKTAGENAWKSVTTFSPEGTNFVCIEPCSPENPLIPRQNSFNGVINLLPMLD